MMHLKEKGGMEVEGNCEVSEIYLRDGSLLPQRKPENWKGPKRLVQILKLKGAWGEKLNCSTVPMAPAFGNTWGW